MHTRVLCLRVLFVSKCCFLDRKKALFYPKVCICQILSLPLQPQILIERVSLMPKRLRMSKIITIFAGGKSGECVERYRREYREGLIKLCNFLRKGEARKKWWRMDLDPANMGGNGYRTHIKCGDNRQSRNVSDGI